jgi:hypothetical protein
MVSMLSCFGFDESAGIHHEDFGLLGALDRLVAGAGQVPEHHLAVQEVLGASEADEADFLHGGSA